MRGGQDWGKKKSRTEPWRRDTQLLGKKKMRESGILQDISGLGSNEGGHVPASRGVWVGTGAQANDIPREFAPG